MSLQDELYFSMVLLRECCASLDNLSTSFSTKTTYVQNNELFSLVSFYSNVPHVHNLLGGFFLPPLFCAKLVITVLQDLYCL